jgi:hypothetical protein
MAIVIPCHRCGHKLSAPDHFAGQQGACPQCGALMSIPAAGDYHAAAGSPPPGNAATAAADQWYVTFPDGRTLGPATREQFETAAARGAFPPEALVRRGDWPHPISYGALLAPAEPGSGPNPYGSYGQQMARNPLGTIFFGPQMPAYQASRDPAVWAERKRLFRYWLYLLTATVGLATLGPLLAGLVVLNPVKGLSGLVLGIFWLAWPGIFIAVGLLLYSGALFEWSWFFNSRRLRGVRAWWGDQGARGLYLWMGGLMVGGGSGVAMIGSLFLIGATFVAAMQPQPAAGNGAVVGNAAGGAGAAAPPEVPRVVRVAENSVVRARADLEPVARDMKSLADASQEVAQRIAAEPNVLAHREEANNLHFQAQALAANYRQRRDRWSAAVAELDQIATLAGAASEVLAANRALPPELVFDLESLEARLGKQFPVNQIRNLERVARNRQQSFAATLESAERQQFNGKIYSSFGNGTYREILPKKAAHTDESRQPLAEFEAEWGYHSQYLDTPTAAESLAAALARTGE